MEVMYAIMPITVIGACGLLWVLLRGIRSGEYEDVEGEKFRILFDETP